MTKIKSQKKRKKLIRINNSKKKLKTDVIALVLFSIFLIGLFAETTRTVPAGAFSEYYRERDNILKLSLGIYDDKLAKTFSIKKTPEIDGKTNKTFVLKEELVLETIDVIEKKNEYKIIKENEVKIVKLIDLEKSTNNIESKKVIKDLKETINISEVEEVIKIAVDTSASKIIVDGEEILIPGSSEKNITYMQILQKPNDLELNLKYAQQQGKIGNYKQTIATLERLNMLYPDNVEIKLYLLSVLVQADSPNKALTIIEEIKTNEDLTPEDLETINEIESTLKESGAPKLWNFYAEISLGGVFNQNVNNVSKTRTQSSSDSVIGFNTAKYDKTFSESLGLTAIRSLGESSSLMINTSFTDSEQREETTDDYESYGLTVALDTSLGNQSLSPYIMISKTDYQNDADSFSLMQGIGGYFSAGDRNSFSYGYSFSDSKNNKNSSDATANATNSIGHGITLGHDFMFNELISSSTGLGYSISEAKDGTNDYETYDLNFRLNLAFPWAYISVGDGLSFNDYKNVDTSLNSNRIRSDVTNTFDLMLTKAVGDFFPTIDPNKSLFMNFSYEKIISEANILNYDYIADSYSISFSKSFHLNK